jgi:hypothetical protein
MSYSPGDPNPYATPQPGSFGPASPPPQVFQEDQPGQPWEMNYFGFMEMIQRDPNWLTTILLAGLCGFIPIVGLMVLWGFAYENAALLHRTSGQRYAPFDFNRFGDYLTRGVGPFLVWLMFYVATQVVSFMMQMCGGLAVGLAGEAGEAVSVLFMLFWIGFLLALSVVVFMIQTPLMLRGGMSGDIGDSFNFNWAVDFVKRCWLELLVVLLVWMAITVPAMLLGLATCCIGFIPITGYLALVNAWLSFQLYRLYLSRGGEPIVMKKPIAP